MTTGTNAPIFKTFVRELEAELGKAVTDVLNHPFMLRLSHGELSRAETVNFVVQYNAYCEAFPRMLAMVASNIPDDKTRLAVVKNLWEEHGSGDERRSHRTLFKRLWDALDIDDAPPNLRSISRETAAYVEAMFDLCRDHTFLEGLGALGPGTESFTGAEYELILQGLRKSGLLSDFDLEFFTVHLDLDGDHYLESLASLADWIDEAHEAENRAAVRTGALAAIDAERRFWDGLLAATT